MNATMRLFVLRYGKSGALVHENGQPLYFANKPEAKAARDALNQRFNDTIVVSIGPDHRLYHKGA